jgi:hypothetical protein
MTQAVNPEAVQPAPLAPALHAVLFIVSIWR